MKNQKSKKSYYLVGTPKFGHFVKIATETGEQYILKIVDENHFKKVFTLPSHIRKIFDGPTK